MRNCAVMGCHNSNYTLSKWYKTPCSKSNGFHGSVSCPCKVPFKLYCFPTERKNSKERQAWISLINRDTHKPKKSNKTWSPCYYSRVCSKHFVDGKPTVENPNPTLNMGYEVKVAKSRHSHNLRSAKTNEKSLITTRDTDKATGDKATNAKLKRTQNSTDDRTGSKNRAVKNTRSLLKTVMTENSAIENAAADDRVELHKTTSEDEETDSASGEFDYDDSDTGEGDHDAYVKKFARKKNLKCVDCINFQKSLKILQNENKQLREKLKSLTSLREEKPKTKYIFVFPEPGVNNPDSMPNLPKSILSCTK